mgnify:CR=1 FL=1
MPEQSVENLEQIPGVGKIIAQDLSAIGIRSCDDLKDRDPQWLYEKLCNFKASPVDRCVLYVFRCVVYWVSNDQHDPKLLKWWNWKDKH